MGRTTSFTSSSLAPHLVEAQVVLDGRGDVEHQTVRRDHDHEPVQRLRESETFKRGSAALQTRRDCGFFTIGSSIEEKQIAKSHQRLDNNLSAYLLFSVILCFYSFRTYICPCSDLNFSVTFSRAIKFCFCFFYNTLLC